MSETKLTDTEKRRESMSKAVKHTKTGLVGLAIGIVVGWMAKIAFDEGKADEFLKSININRDTEDK